MQRFEKQMYQADDIINSFLPGRKEYKIQIRNKAKR